MRRTVLASAVLSCLAIVFLAPLAHSGPNQDGYLILYTDDTIVYTGDDTDTYCLPLSSECQYDPECDDDHDTCASTIAGLNVTSTRGPEAAMIWAIAAFEPQACPRVQGVQFGLEWEISGTQPTFVHFGACGDLELHTDGWPQEPFSGTAVTWTDTVTRTSFPVYWFAAYSYYGPLAISVGDFPTGPYGASFADDSLPSILDPVPSDHRGSIGLNGASGWNPYTFDGPFGACCATDGTCTETTEVQCAGTGGEYLGDFVSCDPNPCNVPVVGTSWGGVKSIFRD
ncbi:MAG: hypothetical protein R3E97_04195 [Candidatus Eisenbacteria bacterium]